MFKNINKSSGQIAKVLLSLVIIVLIAILIAYIVIKRAEKSPPPPLPSGPTEPMPVYEATLGDIRFLFLEATDKGNVLIGKDSSQPSWQKDLPTTERFIEVTVGAQNTGKENTVEKIWDIGEIIDSEGRKFIPAGQKVRNWLPSQENDLCGSVLWPSFEPSPCKKLYEVANVSTGLKIKVLIYEKAHSDKIAGAAVLDIKLMP